MLTNPFPFSYHSHDVQVQQHLSNPINFCRSPLAHVLPHDDATAILFSIVVVTCHCLKSVVFDDGLSVDIKIIFYLAAYTLRIRFVAIQMNPNHWHSYVDTRCAKNMITAFYVEKVHFKTNFETELVPYSFLVYSTLTRRKWVQVQKVWQT